MKKGLVKKEVLHLLRDTSDYISGERIANELNMSRTAVWKHICKLRKDGFCINARTRVGYHLVSSPDNLMPAIIKDKLKTSYIGQDIFYYSKIESTNLTATNLALDEAREGTVVVAERQTRGRGRIKRRWVSPAYSNILMSIILRPVIFPSKVFILTMLTSLSIVKAIKNITGIDAQLKWPNDIYIGNKKVGGILTELNTEQDRVNFVVVGIGLNVNFYPSVYPEIKDTATSIMKVFGKKVSRVDLLRSILEEIEKDYDLLKEGKFLHICDEWNEYSLITGKPVKISSFDTLEEGIAESVDDHGCLIIRDENGNRKSILCGDVSLRLT